MKKLLVLSATLAALLTTALLTTALLTTALPAGAVVKDTTWTSVASSRSGNAVFINGIITKNSSAGVVRSAGRLVYLQRKIGGVWQTMGSRISNVAGRLSVGFIQPRADQYQLIVTGTSTALSSRSAVTGVSAVITSSSSTVIANAYTTGYGWPDNSPPGAVVSGPAGAAGGTGTFTNPITVAVGYVGSVPDYPYGTKFYIPNVRKYFVVQDTCDECHSTPSGSSTWVDMWTGGNGSNNAGILACENAFTGNHAIIRNPDAHRAVVPGALYSGTTCATQFGG
jgi:hypothetical protein